MPRSSLTAVLLVAASLLPAAPVQAFTISLNPLGAPVNAGDSFSVSVDVAGLGNGAAPSIGTYDIGVLFDDALLAYQSTTFGTELSVFFPSLQGPVVPLAGVVQVSESSLDGLADLNAFQPADFTLFTLEFQALAPGAANLDFSASLFTFGDADGLALTPTDARGAVIDVQPAPAPEPGTALLLLGGLLALGGVRLRETRPGRGG